MTSLQAVDRTWRASFVRVLRDDIWAKGFAGTLQTVARMLRLLLRWPAHRAWKRVIGGPTTRGILAVYPRIVYLHSFTYLFAGTNWPQRLAMASAHYAFINARHDAAFFSRVMAPDGLELWRQESEGRVLSIALLGPCLESRHHEGDLTLAFRIDTTVLCRLAFSIIEAASVQADAEPGQHAIYIGHVQGAAGVRDLNREAARLLHAIAPRDLLMNALAGAAQGWGIHRLFGVPGERLLSHEAWIHSSSRFDYARFWDDYGAETNGEGHRTMSLPLREKPLSTIAARHRHRTLVKRGLKANVAAHVARSMNE